MNRRSFLAGLASVACSSLARADCVVGYCFTRDQMFTRKLIAVAKGDVFASCTFIECCISIAPDVKEDPPPMWNSKFIYCDFNLPLEEALRYIAQSSIEYGGAGEISYPRRGNALYGRPRHEMACTQGEV